MKSKLLILSVCAVLGASTVAVVPALAATSPLKGVVGPGFTIKLTAKPKRAGTYKLTVQDKSADHNFHLTGGGVNVKTGVGATGTKTFTVKLKAGKTYRFVCDPHAGQMFGSFKIPA